MTNPNLSLAEKLNEIRKVIDEDKYRKRVLLLCKQTEPRSFDEYSSSGSFRRIEKFESSTYSEVLRAVDMADNNKPVVMKIMRALSKGVIQMLPSVSTKGCQAYNDILNELVVTQALSQLHDGVIINGQPKALFKTHFFCLIHEIKVVSGDLERILTKSQQDKLRAMKTSPSVAVRSTVDYVEDTTKQKPEQQVKGQHQGPTSEGSNGESTEKGANGCQNEELGNGNDKNDNNNQGKINDDEMKNLPEEERMLIEALPHEYVVSVMKHDGKPLWWMMTHKKLSAVQLSSVLVQVIVGLAIAENVYLYEHRDLHVSNILIKKTSSQYIPFVLEGQRFKIISHGVKATIIDATFSRLTHNGKVYFRDLSSTLRAYGSKKTPPKMSLQNRSYRQMVRVTKNKWDDFVPKTNLIWLTYLCETLMKNDVMKNESKLLDEIKKIRDYTLKVSTTLDLLSFFPFEKEAMTQENTITNQQTVISADKTSH